MYVCLLKRHHTISLEVTIHRKMKLASSQRAIFICLLRQHPPLRRKISSPYILIHIPNRAISIIKLSNITLLPRHHVKTNCLHYYNTARRRNHA